MGRANSKDRAVTISAAEIACYAYCPEQWRLEYGMGVEPANRAALDAGTRHHDRKAVAERIAGSSIGLGRLLVILAILGLLVLVAVRR
jgi:hypothetical protein